MKRTTPDEFVKPRPKVRTKKISFVRIYSGIEELPIGSEHENDERINLSWNRIRAIPQNLESLRCLRSLDLTGNKIEIIPSSLGCLTILKRLELSDNKIRFIAPEIGELKTLTFLGLNSNKLKFLPVEVCNLLNLRHLQVANNDLATIPTGLARLTRLQSVMLQNNPDIQVPIQIGSLTETKIYIGWSAILDEPNDRNRRNGKRLKKNWERAVGLVTMFHIQFGCDSPILESTFSSCQFLSTETLVQ
jgi:hypothetical protein